jgi:hypothetical protein
VLIQGTTSYGLHITRSFSFALHGFTDADWVDSIDDRKSTGGLVVFFGQMLISWKSSKQRTVVRSSTEAEYKALADDIAEVIWLQYLLTNLQIPSASAPTIWCEILVLLIYLQILSFMLVLNMLRLTIILYETRLRRKRFSFVLSLPRINLQISLLSRFLLFLLLLFDLSFGSIIHPQLERVYYRIYIYKKYYKTTLAL